MGKTNLIFRIGCFIIWGACSFLMIITGRHMKSLYRVRMIIHSICGVCILVLNFVFSSYASEKYYDD